MRRNPLLLVSLTLGCRAAYPMPEPAPSAELRAPGSARDGDLASVDRVRAMESSCRLRRRGETLRRAADAMDRVRSALGSYCDVDALDGDPLRWRVQCRSDAFFALGEYQLGSGGSSLRPVPCSALGDVPVDRWMCAGALLHAVVRVEGRAAGRVELVTVGGVDRVELADNTRFDGCPTLRTALSPTGAGDWFTPTPGASPELRQRGNEQLAWCRAAAVYRSLRCGVQFASSGTAPLAGREHCVSFPVSPEALNDRVLGAGTAWMSAHPDPASCTPQPPGAPALSGWCPEARRVDVLVSLSPSADPVADECPDANRDPAGALQCLQRCLEHQAAVVRTEAAPSAPLFVPCGSAGHLPRGWISAPPWEAVPASADCRVPDLARLQRALGFAP